MKIIPAVLGTICGLAMGLLSLFISLAVTVSLFHAFFG